MKKTQATLLFAVLCTGMILAGCQKPAAPVSDTTKADIKIQGENKAETTGSIQIVPAIETQASMNIVEQPGQPVPAPVTTPAPVTPTPGT